MGSHGERLSTVTCQLIALDRTLQVAIEASTNDALQLAQGQQTRRAANTRTCTCIADHQEDVHRLADT